MRRDKGKGVLRVGSCSAKVMSYIQKKTQRKLGIKSSRRFAEESTGRRNVCAIVCDAYVLDTRAPVYGCVHTPKNVWDRVQR